MVMSDGAPTRTDRWAPGTGVAADVQLGVAVTLQTGDCRVGHFGDEVDGPQLAAVDVTGQLEVHSVADGIMDDDRLVGEKNGSAGAVAVAEDLGEVRALV